MEKPTLDQAIQAAMQAKYIAIFAVQIDLEHLRAAWNQFQTEDTMMYIVDPTLARDTEQARRDQEKLLQATLNYRSAIEEIRTSGINILGD